jgi:hypothetical protein
MSTLPLTAPDLVCVEDMDLFAAETQSDLESLEQDILHILDEDYGSNPDDPERGIGLANLLSKPTRVLSDIVRTVEAQLRTDDRIDAVKATLTELPPGYSFPGGLTFDKGGWMLELDVVASGAVTGLTYAYSPATGVLVP